MCLCQALRGMDILYLWRGRQLQVHCVPDPRCEDRRCGAHPYSELWAPWSGEKTHKGRQELAPWSSSWHGPHGYHTPLCELVSPSLGSSTVLLSDVWRTLGTLFHPCETHCHHRSVWGLNDLRILWSSHKFTLSENSLCSRHYVDYLIHIIPFNPSFILRRGYYNPSHLAANIRFVQDHIAYKCWLQLPTLLIIIRRFLSLHEVRR